MILGFKGEFIEPILTGKKTSTIRGRSYGLQVGDVVKARCQYHLPPFATLVITKVEAITYAEATLAWPDISETYGVADFYWRISFQLASGQKKRRRSYAPTPRGEPPVPSVS